MNTQISETVTPQRGVSYFIDPEGNLHPVEKCKHREFAERYILNHHPGLLKNWCMEKGELLRGAYREDACKDILVGSLRWITFEPLGTNTNVGFVGRDVHRESICVPLNVKQVRVLRELFEVNDTPLEVLQKFLDQNEKYKSLWPENKRRRV